MNFDDIAPFIFFLGWLGFMALKNIFKKRRQARGSKPASPQGSSSSPDQPLKKSKGTLFGFKKLIKGVRAELEKAVNETNLKANKEKTADLKDAWEELRENDPRNQQGDLSDNLIDDSAAVEHAIFEQGVTEQNIAEQGIPEKFSGSGSMYRSKKQQHTKKINLTTSRLKEAVILSEILAKPVGLSEF